MTLHIWFMVKRKILLDCALEISPAFVFGEALYGIAQHGARHGFVVLLQKGLFSCLATACRFL